MISRREAIQLSLGAAAGLAVVSTNANQTIDHQLTLETRFAQKFQLDHPFVCAGMAFVCETAPLAIAISSAGGAGCLAGTLLSPPTLEHRIKQVKSATDGLFHVNFLTPFPNAGQIEVCIANGVRAVSFHWGFPASSVVNQLKAAGISVWAQVGSLDAAIHAETHGADCIIVQGSEAGGHNYGMLPLAPLLSAVRHKLGRDMILLGAGGISDGATAAAAFAAGADGLWVGTRMVATHESNAHMEHKQRLVRATGENTVLTSVYGPEMPSFNPIRVVRNNITDEWNNKVDQIAADRSDMPSIGSTIFGEQEKDLKPFDSFSPVPETTGDFDQMPIMGGQGVGLIHSIEPAANIMASMMHDAALRLQALSDTRA